MQKITGKRKDAIILAVVAVTGVLGLFLLQMARNRQGLNSDERTVVQSEQEKKNNAAAGPQSAIQSVPTSLLHINDQPEIDVPFHYELTDFSPGGVYQLDPGDGSPRQAFVNGKLSYTYHRPGSYHITIYVLDGATEYPILRVPKEVANRTENKVLNKKSKKVFLDD